MIDTSAGFSQFARERHYQLSMPLPPQINVETVRGCNADCEFCYSGTRIAKGATDYRRTMPKNMFERLVSQLALAEYKGRISFHVNNEPLLDPSLSVRIRELKDACQESVARVMTNGIRLTHEVAEKLFDAGLDMLDVNNYHGSDRISELVTSLIAQYGEPHSSQ